MSKLGACTTALGIVAWVSTATAAPRAVSLHDALAAAAKAPAHRAAHSQVTAAAGDVTAAGAWPSTSLGISSSRSTARLGVVASLPLPVMGTLGADRAVARADLDVARANASSADGDLTRDVTMAWLDLAAAEARAVLSEQAAQRQESLVEIAQARFDAGDSPKVNVVTATAGAARARADAAADAAAIDSASAELAALLGWDPTQRLHADGGIPAPTDVPPLATLRQRRSSHPRARAAAAQVNAEAARVRQVRASHRPSLSLDLESLFDDPTLPGNDYRIGVTVELPLLGKGSAARDAAIARRHVAETQRDATLDTIDGAIVAAYNRYRAAADRAHALTDQVLPAERRAAELARTAYREGQGGLVTVVEAERALADAEAQASEARAQAAQARAQLAWAAGGSL